MKNKKPTNQRTQFPSIYRIITESSLYGKLRNLWIKLPSQSKLKKTLTLLLITFTMIFSLVFLLGIGVLALESYSNLSELNRLSIQRKNLQSQINFWQSVSEKYPEYKDAYFRTALLQYQLGDFQKAEKNNNKALLLDPNFNDAKNLNTFLDKIVIN